jgi:hypothetical protein
MSKVRIGSRLGHSAMSAQCSHYHLGQAVIVESISDDLGNMAIEEIHERPLADDALRSGPEHAGCALGIRSDTTGSRRLKPRGVRHSKGVAALFSGDDLKKVDRENALRLLPRLRT